MKKKIFLLLVIVITALLINKCSTKSVRFVYDNYVENTDKIESQKEKGWFPRWLPITAYDIQGANRIEDESFTWMTFKIKGQADFLINCTSLKTSELKIPSENEIKKLSVEVERSYQEFIKQKSTLRFYECRDNRKYYIGYGGKPEQVIYMWAE